MTALSSDSLMVLERVRLDLTLSLDTDGGVFIGEASAPCLPCSDSFLRGCLGLSVGGVGTSCVPGGRVRAMLALNAGSSTPGLLGRPF